MVSYVKLAKEIRQIDIEVIPIEGTLDGEIPDEEIGVGFYRNLQTYLPRLAEFYMRVNHKRLDKLIEFDCGKIEYLIYFCFRLVAMKLHLQEQHF